MAKFFSLVAAVSLAISYMFLQALLYFFYARYLAGWLSETYSGYFIPVIITQLLAMFLTLLLHKQIYKLSWTDLCLTSPFYRRSSELFLIFFVIVIMFFLIISSSGIIALIQEFTHLDPQEISSRGLSRLGIDQVWQKIILAVILAPLIEELIFRRCIIRCLENNFSPLMTILLSGIIFAAVHLSLSLFLPILLMSCIFSWIYIRTGRLFLTILMHMINNIMALVVEYNNVQTDLEDGSELGIFIYTPAVLILALLIVLFELKFRKNNNYKAPASYYG